MVKITPERLIKVLEVTTNHDYDEKYMVILKDGWDNEKYAEGGVAFFDTQREVAKYIDGAVRV